MRSQALAGLTVTVLGGDDRELVLIPALAAQGATVRVAGFPRLPQLEVAELVSDLQQAVRGANVIILPMPGTDDEGVIRAVYSPTKLVLTEETLRCIPRHAVIFIGTARPFLKNWATRYGLKLVEIAEEDEVAVLNSIPTAEGAIQLAMQELPTTIHGAQAFVVGFGRIGQTLARGLLGLGARVTAVARKPA
ncbi:MAG: dipicolinic acid synthetase subunit A, partial [Clostridia bacterium]|nr:dipicolinic acid synthetase subunit A [Clostridia bacterium]